MSGFSGNLGVLMLRGYSNLTEGKLRLAKISRPVIPDLYHRIRLFDLLDGYRDRQVIWIRGLPGAGKSALISSYIEARKLNYIWYKVDQGDDDPATFFHYLGLAAVHAPFLKAPSLPKLAAELLPNPATFSRNYFREFFGCLETPFVLVFDNYQESSPDSPVHEIIRTALEEIPPKMKVVFLSRGNSPSSLIPMELNCTMAVLSQETLRLTDEESMGIAQLRSRSEPSPKSIQQLNAIAGGWAAGLVLMLEYGHPVKSGLKVTEPFFNYFAGEIFSKLDVSKKELLLKTACLPAITPADAIKMTGFSQAGDLLSDICNRNYFMSKKPGPIYEHHPLFREFLLYKAKEHYEQQELMDNLGKAGDILAQNGQIEDAVELYHSSKKWSSLSELISQQAPILLEQSRFETLEQWLQYLPEHILRSNPWLLYRLGCCRLLFAPADSRKQFVRAFEGFRDKREKTGMFLAASGAVEAIVTEWSDFKRLDPWISVLDDMDRDTEIYPSDEVEVRVVSAMFGALKLRMPQHPNIGKWEVRSMDFIQSDNVDVAQRVMIGGFLAQYRYWKGNLSGALVVIDIMSQLVDSLTQSVMPRLVFLLNEAIHDWHMAEFDHCVQTVSKGLKEGREKGVRIMKDQIMPQAIYASLSRDDLITAKKYLDQMKPVLQSGRLLVISHYHFLVSYYNLLAGNMSSAMEHGQIALKINREVGTPFPEGLVSITVAQIYFELGEGDKAGAHIASAREIGLAMKSKTLEMLLELTTAYFELQRGSGNGKKTGRGGQEFGEKGIEALRRGMEIGRTQGFLNFPGWRSSMMAQLCLKALEFGIEEKYVEDLVRKHKLVPDAPLYETRQWPWPVRIYLLGRFSLVINGQQFSFSGKAQHKPLELLKALIMLGGRDVSLDHLADILWPDADGDKTQRALDTTLHRLRKLMVHKKIISVQDRKLTIDARQCWVDLWALERLLGRVDSACSSAWHNENEMLNLYNTTISLYKGALMGWDLHSSYILPYRERLQNRLLRGLGLLGQYWEENSNWRQASEVYLRILEVDELCEGFYQRLMSCYRKRGYKAEALTVYERCRNNILSKLGVEPSPETKALYRSIRDSG